MADLTRIDKCDQCGSAQAFVQVEKLRADDLGELKNSSLLFCAHHFQRNEGKLHKDGWTLTVDLRDTINVKPSQSSANV